MHTISNIISDISRGCAMNNLNEDAFSYRITYRINGGNASGKYYIDSKYEDLRKNLEIIIRNNLSLTNTLVIAQTTVRKDGRCVCLQSRSYTFSLDEYFQAIYGRNKKRNNAYNRYATAIYVN